MISDKKNDRSIKVLSIVFLLLAILIIVRLFILQIVEHDYYSTFALSSHEIYQKLYPKRGEIFFQDIRNGEKYPAAVNREYYLVYAVPNEIKPEEIGNITDTLSEIFLFDEEEKSLLKNKLEKSGDPYEVVAKKVDEETLAVVEEKKLTGIYNSPQEYRYYPEKNTASNVLGFCGFDDNNNVVGSYGLEGYWQNTLAGEGGFLSAARGASGGWIALAGRDITNAKDGASLVLTIDRNLQYKACSILEKGFLEFKAKSASLILMDAKTGAILSMCSYPDFNPNEYSQVEDIRYYNNTNIFTPYEPGSVFKPIAMAVALDLELVSPNTYFQDPCMRYIDGFEIHNALEECYGYTNMTSVLENSINTGMIWVEEKIGTKRFKKYLEDFGFGKKTGIEINTEVASDISSLDNKQDVYGAVASFGQGITVTPLQLAVAYSALANGGRLPRPYIVEEIEYIDGRKEKTEPKILENVISERASKLINGMLVSVVENGHGKGAQVPGYYVAGKTGTAQIAGAGGYTEETNHTFTGFAPATDPKFVLVVKYEAPQRQWAESTATPIFQQVMDFALKYAGIMPDK